MKYCIGIALILLVEAGSIQAGPPTIGACPVLPADNIWNTPVDQLPLAANSATYVATIGSGTSLKADFGSGTYNGGPIGIPFVTVPGTQTKYPATFTYADESDAGPYAVPLNAPIEGGSQSNGDRHAISVDIDNCLLYELYSAYPQTSSWQLQLASRFGGNLQLLLECAAPLRVDLGRRRRVTYRAGPGALRRGRRR
jgi:hypothetical protein